MWWRRHLRITLFRRFRLKSIYSTIASCVQTFWFRTKTFVQTFLIWKNLFNFLYKIIVQTYLNLSNKFHIYHMLVDESLGFEARLFFRPFGFNFFKHFWEKHWIRRTRFDSGIESNTSFRNFVFVERQFKKPFVSKQDSSRICLD